MKDVLNKLYVRYNPIYNRSSNILPFSGIIFRIKDFDELNLMTENDEFSKLLSRDIKLP